MNSFNCLGDSSQNLRFFLSIFILSLFFFLFLVKNTLHIGYCSNTQTTIQKGRLFCKYDYYWHHYYCFSLQFLINELSAVNYFLMAACNKCLYLFSTFDNYEMKNVIALPDLNSRTSVNEIVVTKRFKNGSK